MILMRSLCFLLVFFISQNKLFGQYFSGKIIDASTKAGIPFVSIQNGNTGTSSDINGFFKIQFKDSLNIVKFSCLGYSTIYKKLAKAETIVIELQINIQALKEITIRPEKNPAIEIIKKAIENKDYNNPKNLTSYSYNSYNKISATLKNDAKALKKDSSLRKRISTNEILVSESIVNHKYRKKNLLKEKVIATKTSGIKSPLLASLLTDFQPMSFYDDFFFTTITDKYYLNPLADSKFEKYNLSLLDTLIQNEDSTFVIAFSPKQRSNFDGLTGYFHINNNRYAIKQVVAESNEKKSTISFEIQQAYNLIDNHWFPVQNSTNILIKDTTNLMYGVSYVHKSTFTNIEINKNNPRAYFDSFGREIINTNENQRDSLFALYRSDSLTIREKNTYQYYDKSKKTKSLNTIYSIYESLLSGKLTLKKIRLPLHQLVNFNNFEGYRLGFGFETISDFFGINSYFGYGLKDKRVKYGIGISLNLNPRYERKLDLFFQNDVEEPANSNYEIKNGIPYSLRSFLSYRMDSVSKIGLTFKNSFSNKISVALSIIQEKRKALYAYQLGDFGSDSEFINTEASFFFSFHNEKKMNTGRNVLVLSNAKPYFYARIAQSLDLFGSMFDYTKINIGFENQLLSKGFGQTLYKIDMGFVKGNMPYSYLYNGQGSNREGGIRYIKNAFQTMGLYEFVSDKYMSFVVNQNFGQLLYKGSSKYFSPELTLYHGFLFGDLENKNAHKNIDFIVPTKGFFEGGLIINKLLHFRYLKTIYIDLGVGLGNVN